MALGAARLVQCVELLSNPQQAYARSTDPIRRQLNTTFYERFYLDDDSQPAVTSSNLKPPFGELHHAAENYLRYQAQVIEKITKHKSRNLPATALASDYSSVSLADSLVSGSSKNLLVAGTGFEPVTSGL